MGSQCKFSLLGPQIQLILSGPLQKSDLAIGALGPLQKSDLAIGALTRNDQFLTIILRYAHFLSQLVPNLNQDLIAVAIAIFRQYSTGVLPNDKTVE